MFSIRQWIKRLNSTHVEVSFDRSKEGDGGEKKGEGESGRTMIVNANLLDCL